MLELWIGERQLVHGNWIGTEQHMNTGDVFFLCASRFDVRPLAHLLLVSQWFQLVIKSTMQSLRILLELLYNGRHALGRAHLGLLCNERLTLIGYVHLHGLRLFYNARCDDGVWFVRLRSSFEHNSVVSSHIVTGFCWSMANSFCN
jgi:hypothetical protein